jgi:hypothetical protein
MRTRLLKATVFMVGLLASHGTSYSQYQYPSVQQRPFGYQPTPTVSPYINLLRRDIPPVFNYYGLVRPELNAQRSLQSLQQQVSLQQDTLRGLEALPPGTLVTGHPAYFLNLSHYFLYQGGLGTQGAVTRPTPTAALGATAGPGAAPPPTRPARSR